MKKIMLIGILMLPFILGYGQDWVTNFEEAKSMADQDDKKIIMVFQGSDWCGPCRKMDKLIWSTDDFKAYAKDHFVMLQVDFPRKKKNRLSEAQTEANKVLAEEYNQTGFFPFVVLMDKDGNILKETGYKKLEPLEFVEYLNQ